jgi:hypothetical protein
MKLTKSTWVTRHLPPELLSVWSPLGGAVVGDVLACEVDTVSPYGRVETADGARSRLYPGDRIACVVGNRYATSMREGVATVDGPVIDLLSASGVCGKVLDRSERTSKPTTLRVLGQFRGRAVPINLRSFHRRPSVGQDGEPVWIVVVGSAMDAGKTTACASLVRGLRTQGHRVAAAKLTGTASARDVGSFRDAGADPVVDFSDLGWPATAGCSEAELRAIVADIGEQLRADAVDVAVLRSQMGCCRPRRSCSCHG